MSNTASGRLLQEVTRRRHRYSITRLQQAQTIDAAAGQCDQQVNGLPRSFVKISRSPPDLNENLLQNILCSSRLLNIRTSSKQSYAIPVIEGAECRLVTTLWRGGD